MGVPISIEGNRAILNANPGAEVVSFLDKWGTHGYIASIGMLDENYVLKEVTYDLTKVGVAKVREIATKIGAGVFSCPTCQKMKRMKAKAAEATAIAKAGTVVAESTPLLNDTHQEQQQPKQPRQRRNADLDVRDNNKGKETPTKIVQTPTNNGDDDDEETQRERAIKKLVTDLDSILLFRNML